MSDHSWDNGPSTDTIDRGATAAIKVERYFLPDLHTEREEVTSPELAAKVLSPMLLGADREMCVMASLDTKHRLLGTNIVSIGAVSQTFMSPREIFRDALLQNASAIVVAHNHPSGDPEPSRDDEAVTRRLSRAGELIGVDLLDHLVFGDTKWVSLARRGVI